MSFMSNVVTERAKDFLLALCNLVLLSKKQNQNTGGLFRKLF